jgi:hypothetical protein
MEMARITDATIWLGSTDRRGQFEVFILGYWGIRGGDK